MKIQKSLIKTLGKDQMTVLLKTTSFKDTQKRPNNSCFKRKEYIKTLGKDQIIVFIQKQQILKRHQEKIKYSSPK